MSVGLELDQVVRDGWATSVGDLEASLFGASSAVLSDQGRPVAIVSVWGPEHRLTRERLPEVGRRTLEAAELPASSAEQATPPSPCASCGPPTSSTSS